MREHVPGQQSVNRLRKSTSIIVEILLLTSNIEAELNVGHVFALQANLYSKMLGQNVKIQTSHQFA